MSSLFQVHLPSLLPIQRSEGGQMFPWPNGSLLSGRLVMDSDGQGMMLLLGNYRLRAEVPPNTPTGHVWLQLLKKASPSQFRLLTETQAQTMLANLLQQQDEEAITQEKPRIRQTSSWGRLYSDHFPFLLEARGDYATLRDKTDKQPQGLLQEQSSSLGFRLSGRLDMPKLGALSFSLHGTATQWKLDMHFVDAHVRQEVWPALCDWLESRQAAAEISSEVVDSPCFSGHVLNHHA